MASFPWPWGLRITGSLTASAVTVQLERDLTWAMEMPLAPARAVLTGSTWIEPPTEISPTPLTEHGAIITAGELRLADLHLGRNGMLTLERSADRTLRITTGGAAGSMTLEA